METVVVAFFSLVLLLSSGPGRTEEIAPSFRVGTRWTFVQHDGSPLISFVERHSTLETSKGKISAAVVRQSDGTDRLVFRTDTQWFECSHATPEGVNVNCDRPILVFQWPLEPGASWTTGGLKFRVMAQEPVETPFRSFENAFRIAYTPVGELQPLGEYWVVGQIGRIQVKEKEAGYRLSSFDPGQGRDIEPSSATAVDALLNSDGPSENTNRQPRAPSFVKLPVAWQWALAAGLAIFLPFLLLGGGLVSSLRKREASTLASTSATSEELRLLAAVARAGDTKKARERLEELVQQHPDYADLQYQLAVLCRGDGDFEKAEIHFREALKRNSSYAEARLGLAQLLYERGSAADAANELEIVIENRPRYADAYMLLAKAQIAMGSWNSAQETLEASLRLNPNFQEARILLENCRKSAQTSSSKDS